MFWMFGFVDSIWLVGSVVRLFVCLFAVIL